MELLYRRESPVFQKEGVIRKGSWRRQQMGKMEAQEASEDEIQKGECLRGRDPKARVILSRRQRQKKFPRKIIELV
jgi:hypothetical protein